MLFVYIILHVSGVVTAASAPVVSTNISIVGWKKSASHDVHKYRREEYVRVKIF